MKLDFYDCNAQVGRYGSPIPESYFTGRELLDHLAPMNIGRALVFHALSKELHPAEGNPAVLEEVKGLPLTPCWVAMPHHTGETLPPAKFVQQMREAGVRAVRLFPNLHAYSLSDWCSGELLDELERNQVPVLMEIAQASYDAIAAALKSHPDLHLTLLQTSYRCDRYLFPLMERYGHLSMETGGYVVSGGVEEICGRFGASRLVFGTGAPFFEPGAAVSQITYADISDADKQAVASGNLERLISWNG